MDIGIFIEYDNQVVQFPVNPEKFNVSTDGNNETEEIIALGEIVIPRKQQLSEISWDSFFPHEAWFPAIRTLGDFRSSSFYLNFLNKIRDDCRPCHLTVTGIDFDDDVVIESFSYYHQAGDHEDTYYSITFKRYQPYGVSIVSKVDIENQIKNLLAPTDPSPAPSPSKTTMGKPSATSPTLSYNGITVGCEIFLNGRVHMDSSGAKPGTLYSNWKVRVNLINKKGRYPYHVTNLSGDALGWVDKASVSLSSSPMKYSPPLKTKIVDTFSPVLRAGGGGGGNRVSLTK